MNKFLIIPISLIIFGCGSSNQNDLQQLTLGLGEYMAMVEYHHTNLGKAISIKNYQRAHYELDELDEVFEKIKLFHAKHDKLVQPIDSLLPVFFYTPISKLREAINKNDSITIHQKFIALTNGCNSCHTVNKMEFITVN
jgi:hypothetical protein